MYSEELQISGFLSSCNSIKTFDFSAIYSTIPHSKLKENLRELVQLCFMKKMTKLSRYKYIVLGRDTSYFAKHHSDSTKTFSETDIFNMHFFLTTYFFIFGGRVFQQTVGIPMDANCAPLLADLFLYSYETDFKTRASQEKRKEASLIR